MLMVVAAAGISGLVFVDSAARRGVRTKEPSAASARSEIPASPVIAPAGFADDFQDESCHPGVNQLGRIIARWCARIVARRPLPGVERTRRSGQ